VTEERSLEWSEAEYECLLYGNGLRFARWVSAGCFVSGNPMPRKLSYKRFLCDLNCICKSDVVIKGIDTEDNEMEEMKVVKEMKATGEESGNRDESVRQLDEREKNLIREAFLARQNAYAPYSGFFVGAALLAEDGRVFRGCNVENASYGATMCAERTALFSAVAAGCRDFSAIAIAGGAVSADEESEAASVPDAVSGYAYPCGICRQALSEFCGPDFKVIVAKSSEEYRVYTLGGLLPESFQL